MATNQNDRDRHNDQDPSKKQTGTPNADPAKKPDLRSNIGNTGMNSEQSGNNPADMHQGSSVSGQTGLHNKQQSSNLSNQGMAGQQNAQSPSGHFGQDSNEPSRSASTGGSGRNEKLMNEEQSDLGQGNAGKQGQYSGQDAQSRKADQDDANRQRKDYADLSKKGKLSDEDKPDRAI